MTGMNTEALQGQIRNLIAEIVEIEPKEIALEANFAEDLGMDSMMALEILASIEKKFNLKIPEENLVKMVNLKEVLKIVNQFA